MKTPRPNNNATASNSTKANITTNSSSTYIDTTNTHDSNPGNPHSTANNSHNISPLTIPSLIAATGEEVRFIYLSDQKKVTAYVVSSPALHDHGKEVLRLVRSEDLPKELGAINDPEALKSFLANAYAKVTTFDNGDVKLYVEQRGVGRGKEDRNQESWNKLLAGIKDLAASNYASMIGGSHKKQEDLAPQVFISYAWEAEGSKELASLQRWLGGLRDDLQVAGMSVFLDIGDMTGSIEACMTENLAQSDIILTINTAKYNARATDKVSVTNNLRFEYHLTLERAAINPKSVIPLHYSATLEEAFGAIGGANELAGLKILWIRNCQNVETYGEQLVTTKGTDADTGLIPTIYNIARGIDISNDGEYKQLVQHWREGKLNYLPSISPVTVERSEIFEIEKALQANDGKEVISGVSGSGKSELALKYAKDHAKEYAITRWLKAADLELEFKLMGGELALDTEGAGKTNIADLVYEQLESVSSWLLIFDNAESFEAIKGHLPERLKEGQHVLITSRSSEWDGIESNIITIGGLKREEALEYMEQMLPNITTRQAAELADNMSTIPSDLHNAAVFIKRSGISVSKYLSAYKSVAPEQIADMGMPSDPQLQKIGNMKTEKQSASPFSKALVSMRDMVEQSSKGQIKAYVSYAEEQTLEANNNAQSWIKKLASDLKEVNVILSSFQSGGNSTSSSREEQIKDSDAIFIINTPAYKAAVTNDPNSDLAKEYQLILAKAKIIPYGLLPILYSGKFGDSVPKELWGYLIRDFTDEATYESRLMAQNPLGIVPAIHKIDCDSSIQYRQIIKQWRWESLSKLPPINPDFIGRDEQLNSIAQSFDKAKSALGQIQAISSSGGMGKSELAITFANKNAQNYIVTRWLNTEGENLRLEFDQITRELGIDTKDMEHEQLIKTVHRHLLEIPKYLLIFDNADTAQSIKQYLPKEANEGQHILITSRSDHWQCKHISLDQFTKKEALLYINSKLPNTSQEEATKLANTLEYMPLALSQAVAYITQENIQITSAATSVSSLTTASVTTATKSAYTITDYLSGESMLFKTNDNSNIGGSSDPSQRYQYNVQTTLAKSMKRVAERSPEAAKMITLCAYLASDNIPAELFEHQALLGDVRAVHKALITLKDYSLVRLSGLEDHIKVHRLVQTVIKYEHNQAANKEEVKKQLVAIGEALAELYPSEKTKEDDYEKAKLLLPHMEMLGNSIGLLSKMVVAGEYKEGAVTQANLLNITGDIFEILGDGRKSLESYEKALKMHEALYQGNHPDIAMSLNNVGVAYQKLGDNAKSLEFKEKALKMQEALYQGNHPGVATSLNNVALTYHARGDKMKALELFKQAYIMRLKALGQNHPDTKDIKNYLARVAATFIEERETREFLALRGDFDATALEVKQKIQSSVLNKVLELAFTGKGDSNFFSSKIKQYINDVFLAKELGSLANNNTSIEIAKMLCFETINLSIMIMGTSNKNFGCTIEFAKAYPELIRKISQVHPEYFVDGAIVRACVSDPEIKARLLGGDRDEHIEGEGLGAEEYGHVSYWHKYTKAAMDKMLQLRLESIKVSNEEHDKEAQANKIISPDYVWDDQESTAAKLIADIALNLGRGVEREGEGGEARVIILPLNLYNKHWVGIAINAHEGRIDITYMDSQQKAMPGLLREALSTLDLHHPITITEKGVEQQKSNNCSLEVIENFMLHLTGYRLEQENALPVHAFLYEDSLFYENAHSS